MQSNSIRRAKSGFWSTPAPLRLRRRGSGKTPPPGHQHHCCRAAYSNAGLFPNGRTAEVPSVVSQQRHRLRDAATAGMASPKWSKTSVGTLLAIDSQWERIFRKSFPAKARGPGVAEKLGTVYSVATDFRKSFLDKATGGPLWDHL